jgi:hypothetical protein
MSYDPNSPDAMFSRIMGRLDDQDKVLTRIEAQTTKTNGRVSKLETEHWKQRGFIFAVSFFGAALWEWLTKK